MRLLRHLPLLVIVVAAGCATGERPTLSSPPATAAVTTTEVPLARIDPSVDITFFGFPFGMEASLEAMAVADGGRWDVRPGDGRGLCAALEQGADGALFDLAVDPPPIPCALDVRSIGTRAVYVYASDDVPELDLDLLRAVFVDAGRPPHLAIGTDQAEWEWVIHDLLSATPPPPDRLVLAFGPDAIREAIAAGDTVAYSAFTPADVGLAARCVAAIAGGPCIPPSDRDGYPLVVPMWFGVTSMALETELITAMLKPDIVAASAAGGVVIEG
ncbi:MAG: hypothetical protein AAF081_01830 [Actinomycetota bacterium]